MVIVYEVYKTVGIWDSWVDKKRLWEEYGLKLKTRQLDFLCSDVKKIGGWIIIINILIITINLTAPHKQK